MDTGQEEGCRELCFDIPADFQTASHEHNIVSQRGRTFQRNNSEHHITWQVVPGALSTLIVQQSNITIGQLIAPLSQQYRFFRAV